MKGDNTRDTVCTLYNEYAALVLTNTNTKWQYEKRVSCTKNEERDRKRRKSRSKHQPKNKMYECNLQSPSQPTDFPIPVTLNCYPLQWIWDKNNPTKKWQRIIHYKRVHIKWPSKEKLTNSNMCEQERVSTSLMEPTTLTVGNMWHFSASFAKFLSIVLLWCFFFQFGINDSCHSFHVSFFILSTFSFSLTDVLFVAGPFVRNSTFMWFHPWAVYFVRL